MEGTQPSAAGGDGAPTAMVAVPGLPGALTQAFPLLGGSGTVSMEASLRLRAKDYAAHDRWLVNLQDVITSNCQRPECERRKARHACPNNRIN